MSANLTMTDLAFPAAYLMSGNRREQVKQSGNAVTTVVEAITGEVAA